MLGSSFSSRPPHLTSANEPFYVARLHILLGEAHKVVEERSNTIRICSHSSNSANDKKRKEEEKETAAAKNKEIVFVFFLLSSFIVISSILLYFYMLYISHAHTSICRRCVYESRCDRYTPRYTINNKIYLTASSN